MARNAHSFGEISEFSVWAHENAEMFKGTSHTTTAVEKKYKESTGRSISPGAVKRVFVAQKFPLHSKRGGKGREDYAGIFAREIVTLNENLRAMAEAVGYPEEALKKAGHMETIRKLAGKDED